MEENNKLSESGGETGKGFEEEFDSVLEGIPKEERHEFKRMIGMSMQMGGAISPQLELMKKMTSEHVTDFLQGQREATRYEFKESRDNKLFSGFMLFIVLVFVLMLVILLRDRPETMEKILYAAGGFAAGIAGGYGYGKTKKDN